MSSSRVSMNGRGPLELVAVRCSQSQGGSARFDGATRVGIFSEQVWGVSDERHQGGQAPSPRRQSSARPPPVKGPLRRYAPLTDSSRPNYWASIEEDAPTGSDVRRRSTSCVAISRPAQQDLQPHEVGPPNLGHTPLQEQHGPDLHVYKTGPS